jgi:cobalt-zinc-cadmium efflux system outer membrane protein
MQRPLLLVACLLVLPALHDEAGAVSAQAIPPGRLDEASADILSITLSEAQRQVLSRSPELLAERREIEIARGQLTQARVLAPNPELDLRAPGGWSNGAIDEFEISLSQELEVAGQRRQRIRAADFGLSRSEATVDDAIRRTLADASHAFFEALAAQERLTVVTELDSLNRRLVEVTRIQTREGEISVMDANLAEIEAGRARARRLAAEREALAARLELKRLIGIPPGQEIRLVAGPGDLAEPADLNPDVLLSLALSRRPDLAAWSRAMEEADARATLARREAIPSPRVGVFIEREERHPAVGGTPDPRTGLGSPRVGVGVSLPIPLFQRNQGIVAENRARSEQARYHREATELAIRAEVMAALDAYRSAGEEIRVLEEEALLPARENQRLLDVAFQEGRIALPTLLLLRNQLLDAELSYWDAWLAAHRALVDLQSATATLGANTTPDSMGDPR